MYICLLLNKLTMKKIILSAMALTLGSISFGQQVNQEMIFGENDLASESKSTSQSINNKALGTVIYTNDFDTPSDWVMDNNSQVTPLGWTIDAVSDGWWSTAGITSTSGGNFAELYNGPSGAPIQGVTYTLTTAAPIDLIALGGPGSQVSTLEFEQFGARFNDLMEIQISTDGTTFVTVGDNFDFSVLSASGGSPFPNPHLKRINLSSALTAVTATSVWIRFSWTTNFPSSTSAGAWITYGWYIDDIKITTNADNDLTIFDPYFGTAAYPYSRIPVSEIQPIEFTAKAINSGTATQTDVVLNVDINGATQASSTPQDVLVGSTDSLVATTWTPPTTLGVPYAVTLSINGNEIDDIPVDNAAVTFAPFEITDYIYAYDDYDTPANQGAGGGVNGTDAGFEAGNSFDIWAAENLMAIDVVVGAGTPIGSNFKGVLYERISTAPFYSYVAGTQYYATNSSSIGNVTQLLFSAPIPLTAGKTYFVGMSTLSEFYFATSGTSPGQGGTAAVTSVYYYGTMDAPISGKNYYTTSTPMVRMNFDPTLPVGLDELKDQVKFNVFPNPSNGVFNINLSSNDNVNLTVKNVVGQTVITETVNVSGNTNHKISLTDYSKGIYFLTVGTETVKLIVE